MPSTKEQRNEAQRRWREKHPETEAACQKRCHRRQYLKNKEYYIQNMRMHYFYNKECQRLRNILLIDFIGIE